MLQQTPYRSDPRFFPAPAKPDACLLNDWHVVAFSKDVKEGELLPIRLLGEELVAWRHAGKVHLWKDLCIHRGAQLSKGWCERGDISSGRTVQPHGTNCRECPKPR